MGKKERKRHFKREDVGLNAEHLSRWLNKLLPPPLLLLIQTIGTGFCINSRAGDSVLLHLTVYSTSFLSLKVFLLFQTWVIKFIFVLIFLGPKNLFHLWVHFKPKVETRTPKCFVIRSAFATYL